MANGKTSACVTAACLENAILFTTSPHLFKDWEVERFAIGGARTRSSSSATACDCYAYALLAAGHVDLVIETVLKPYDVGALIPIIEQAGGIITTWDGGRPEAGGSIIAAGSEGRARAGDGHAEAQRRSLSIPQGSRAESVSSRSGRRRSPE